VAGLCSCHYGGRFNKDGDECIIKNVLTFQSVFRIREKKMNNGEK
jgi:hypothetical protein